MSEQFAESVFNCRHKVLGLHMQPFTLWHAWQLEFAGISFQSSGAFSFSDLIYAACVCAREAGAPGDVVRVRGWRKFFLCRRAFRAGALDAARGDFAAYVADFHAPPLMWESGDGKPVRSPWILYCVAALMRHGGLGLSEAWATPVGYARHLCAALAEAGGAEVPIINAAEARAMKEAGY